MIDLGVALTWAAISAASVKGLAVFARAARTGDTDIELPFAGDASTALVGLRSIGTGPHLWPTPTNNLTASSDAPDRPRARL